MSSVLRRCLPFVLVFAASIWLATWVETVGDWSAASHLAIAKLSDGDLQGYLSVRLLVGPFATLLQTPFAMLAGGGELNEYRWASLPCLVAAGLLGIYLASIARRRGASRFTQLAVATLCLVNPLTVEALENGHPEEVLTAALAVGAIATASERRYRTTAVLLGLALASKQWAAMAILPTLMALPARRVAVACAAAAIAAIFTLPGLLASPGTFFGAQEAAAISPRYVTPWSLWYPFAQVRTETYGAGSAQLVATVHQAPPWIGSLAHSLVGLLVFGMPLALAWRRGRFRLAGQEAMALLALLALIRCALDPADNFYYHTPLFLALVGWDALGASRLPVKSLAGVAVALAFWRWLHHLSNVELFNAAYMATILAAAGGLLWTLFRRPSAKPPPAPQLDRERLALAPGES